MPITVAIPTYNRRDRVRALVESVLPQLAPDDELIVADDASDDGTSEEFASLAKVTVRRHPARLGMVANWNDCLRAASHEWVCLLHDDDRLLPNGLATIRRVCELARGPSLIAHQLSDGSVSAGDELAYSLREPGAYASLRAEFCPSAVTIHREVIAQAGVFDPAFRYSADMEYFARVCARFPSYVIEHPTVLQYVMHADNYQLKTWRQPDFFAQLERAEVASVAHAGLPASEAEKICRLRLLRDLFHMLRTSQRAGDRQTVKTVARRLRGQGDFGWSGRAVLLMASLGGWYPARLLR